MKEQGLLVSVSFPVEGRNSGSSLVNSTGSLCPLRVRTILLCAMTATTAMGDVGGSRQRRTHSCGLIKWNYSSNYLARSSANFPMQYSAELIYKLRIIAAPLIKEGAYMCSPCFMHPHHRLLVVMHTIRAAEVWLLYLSAPSDSEYRAVEVVPTRRSVACRSTFPPTRKLQPHWLHAATR